MPFTAWDWKIEWRHCIPLNIAIRGRTRGVEGVVARGRGWDGMPWWMLGETSSVNYFNDNGQSTLCVAQTAPLTIVSFTDLSSQYPSK